jgi:hypothetical protein
VVWRALAQAGWNAYVKRRSGGLKPSEARAAVLLFCTWSFYVVGGVCGAAVASFVTFHWSLTPVALVYAIGMASMQIELPPPPQPSATVAQPAPTTQARVQAGDVTLKGDVDVPPTATTTSITSASQGT